MNTIFPHKVDNEAEAFSVLLKLIENLKFKVSKETLWSRDLHEFTSDYSLSANKFDVIRQKLTWANQTISSHECREVTNSSVRPCWAIVRRESIACS